MSVPNNDSPAPARASSFVSARPRARREDYSHIALALARFQQKVAQSALPRRLRINSVWAACASLTTAAFVGGLALAHYPFVSPERSITVVPPLPETMYLPPPQGAAATLAALHGGIAPESTVSTLALAQSRSASATADLMPGIGAKPSDANAGSAESADLDLRELARVWRESVRVASAKDWEHTLPPAAPLQMGYAGVELTAVPEASTGVVIAIGLAALLAWPHRGGRRS